MVIQYRSMFSLESFKAILRKSVPFFVITVIILISFGELSQIAPQKAIAISGGKNQVSITITNPPPTLNQTIQTNFTTINGTTYNSGESGIKEVNVLISKIP